MQIDLTGKNALVTGGTRGIGRIISRTLADSGARIAAIYRSDDEAAATTLSLLPSVGSGKHITIKADISVEDEATRAVAQAGEALNGAIDILVLDAAVGAGGPLAGMTTADWKRPFDVNVHGAFYVVRAAAPMLQRDGSLIFLSSGAGHDPLEGLSAYGASKAAVNHMAAILAQELGPSGVRVNVVSPGHTDKSGDDPNANPAGLSEGQKRIAETTALRRVGIAQDVANVVLFFASPLSGFVTGQWIRVNGGRV